MSASEAGTGEKFDEPLVKQITGRDTVVARFLFKEFTEFKPQFKVFLASNHMPKIVGMDDTIWNRINVIPFDVQVPKEEQDKNLNEKLKKKLRGVLAWAVKGCLEYQEQGLSVSSDASGALSFYRDEADIVRRFIRDCCFRIPGGWSTSAELFGAWEAWCRKNRLDAGSIESFGHALETRGFEGGRTRMDGVQQRIRKGIVLKSKAEEQLGMEDKVADEMRQKMKEMNKEYLKQLEKEKND